MKKVLIVTYYWPPAGGPGIQRVIKIVKRLPALGWQPVILTVADGDYPALDHGLEKEVPAECIVYKTDIIEPYNLYRKLTGKKKDEKIPTFVLNPQKSDSSKEKIAKWVRAKLFIPDARIGWIPYAVKAGKKIVRDEKIDVIFSTSPPQTVQLIAKKIAKKTGVKWVADFRDPWTEAFWVAELQEDGLVKRINTRMERSVLSRANAVTTVTKGITEIFAEKAPNNYQVIQNGFETVNAEKILTDRFMILFFGHLNKYQHWAPLFKAIEMLSSDIAEKIDVVFIGKVFDGFQAAAAEYPQVNLQVLPYKPYDEMMAYSRQTSLLFRPLAQMSYAHQSIGAKTYDYLALRKPILAVGPKKSLVGSVLEETDSGKNFSPEESKQMAAFITAQFQAWEKEGHLLLPDHQRLDPYRSASNIEKLVTLFESVRKE